MPGMQPGFSPGGGMPGAPPTGPGGSAGYPPAPQQGGANKTMLLQPSEGIVSVARTGNPVQPAGHGLIQRGATPLFWAVSLTMGVVLGVLAYVIVLQMV